MSQYRSEPRTRRAALVRTPLLDVPQRGGPRLLTNASRRLTRIGSSTSPCRPTSRCNTLRNEGTGAPKWSISQSASCFLGGQEVPETSLLFDPMFDAITGSCIVQRQALSHQCITSYRCMTRGGTNPEVDVARVCGSSASRSHLPRNGANSTSANVSSI